MRPGNLSSKKRLSSAINSNNSGQRLSKRAPGSFARCAMRSKLKTEYGLIGAGGVNARVTGQLPRNAVALGPVGGVSFRVASRIANTLKAGWPVRSLDE